MSRMTAMETSREHRRRLLTSLSPTVQNYPSLLTVLDGREYASLMWHLFALGSLQCAREEFRTPPHVNNTVQPFFKAEMTPCLFANLFIFYLFFGEKGRASLMMMMMKWRPHNPGPRQLPPWNSSNIEHFILTYSYGGKSYTTYCYLVLCTELLPNYSFATFTYVNS